MGFTEDTPTSDETPDLADVRRRLALVTGEPYQLVDLADALLLLPSSPVAGRHTVSDVSPHPPSRVYSAGPAWTWCWNYVRVLMDNLAGIAPHEQKLIRLNTNTAEWLSIEQAETMAGELLSAAARARRAAQ
jgi:hypothetical protein